MTTLELNDEDVRVLKMILHVHLGELQSELEKSEDGRQTAALRRDIQQVEGIERQLVSAISRTATSKSA